MKRRFEGAETVDIDGVDVPSGFGGILDLDGAGDISADLQLEAMIAASQAPQPNAANFIAGAAGACVAPPQNIMAEPRVIETSRMDFSKLTRDQEPVAVPVQRDLVEYLMTSEHRKLFAEECGANVEWVPKDAKVLFTGSPEQVNRAKRLLARVSMHCRWGVSEDKVRRLIKPRQVETAKVRLSPMNTLKPFSKTLSPAEPVLAIGKERGDVIIKDELVSRIHCVLELDEDKGAVYVLDCSTNGTFLNGFRLPGKNSGKVLLSHGDELLLKDPANGDTEFGYIVNIDELSVRKEVNLEAPRRLLTSEEMSSTGRDLS